MKAHNENEVQVIWFCFGPFFEAKIISTERKVLLALSAPIAHAQLLVPWWRRLSSCEVGPKLFPSQEAAPRWSRRLLVGRYSSGVNHKLVSTSADPRLGSVWRFWSFLICYSRRHFAQGLLLDIALLPIVLINCTTFMQQIFLLL